MAVDDLGEHVGEVAERLDVVQLAHLDQRSDNGPVLGATFRAGEEDVLPVERDRADRPLDRVGADFDAAVPPSIIRAGAGGCTTAIGRPALNASISLPPTGNFEDQGGKTVTTKDLVIGP